MIFYEIPFPEEKKHFQDQHWNQAHTKRYHRDDTSFSDVQVRQRNTKKYVHNCKGTEGEIKYKNSLDIDSKDACDSA